MRHVRTSPFMRHVTAENTSDSRDRCKQKQQSWVIHVRLYLKCFAPRLVISKVVKRKHVSCIRASPVSSARIGTLLLLLFTSTAVALVFALRV